MNVSFTRNVLIFVLGIIALIVLVMFVLVQSANAQTSPPNIDEEIVYLDADGVIQILDTSIAADGALMWSSPQDGFTDFALGDFNADGDLEIAAIRNQSLDGEIIVYDPVVSSAGVIPDGYFGDVPWKTLATIGAPADLLFVEAGNMDVGVQGDEILYAFQTDIAASAVTVLKGNQVIPTGTTWLKHIDKVDFSWVWGEVAVGNVDGEGPDEIVLFSNKTVDDEVSRLHAYRLDDGGLVNQLPFAERDGIDFSWQDVAIGEVKNAGFREIVAVRDSDSASFPNIIVYQYFRSGGKEGLRFDPGDEEFVNPSPNSVFLGDVNGIFNSVSDNEIGLLRTVPNSSTQPHFFTRNSGNDDSEVTEFDLNFGSNAYRAGAAGDVDGDGKAEFVVMGNNAIRVFSDSARSGDLVDYTNQVRMGPITTDAAHIEIGNLDGNGVLEPVEVSISVTGLDSGFALGASGTATIRLESEFPVDYTLGGGLPSWITSIDNASGSTPAEITVNIDTAGLDAGEYSRTFPLSSNNPFARFKEDPLELTLNVLAETFSVDTGIYRDGRIVAAGYPCTDANRTKVTTEIEINGSAKHASYTAVIVGSFPVSAAQVMPDADADAVERSDGAQTIRWPSGVEWISAESETGLTDETMTLTFDTGLVAQSAQNLVDAWLIVVADEEAVAAPFNVQYIPMTFICAASQINLPIIDVE